VWTRTAPLQKEPQHTLRGHGHSDWVLAGYMTLYYFMNPVLPRPKCLRVCQVLILPPFQRRGLGALLFRIAGSHPNFAAASNVHELTVESPCEGFARMRDAVDLDRFVSLLHDTHDGPLAAVKQATSESWQTTLRPDAIWNRALGPITRDKLRITTGQACRSFEALMLARLPLGDDDAFKTFRLAVKRRLYPRVLETVQQEGLESEVRVSLFRGFDPSNRLRARCSCLVVCHNEGVGECGERTFSYSVQCARTGLTFWLSPPRMRASP